MKKEKEKKNIKITMLEHVIIDFCIRRVPIQSKNIAMKTFIDIYMLKMVFLSKLAAQISCYSATFHKDTIATASQYTLTLNSVAELMYMTPCLLKYLGQSPDNVSNKK